MPVAEATGGLSGPELIVMTEAEFASMREEQGATVIERDGRYWEVPYPGFYQPIHLLARFRAAALAGFRTAAVWRPSLFCWGFRAALTDEDAHLANGSIPVHLLVHVGQFTEAGLNAGLNKGRREDLRKCDRQVELRRLRDPSLLLEQGYGVFRSAQLRVPYGRPLTQEEYLRRIEQRVLDQRRVFVAGLVDGRLAGYADGYAVDGVLYLDQLFVRTEYVHTGIATGLYVEVIKIGARTSTIHEVNCGAHLPEKPGITAFKVSLGATIVQVPARVAIPTPIDAYLEARRPLTHYHLRGVKPGAAAAAQQ